MKRRDMLATAAGFAAMRALPARAAGPGAPLPINVGASLIESYAEGLYAEKRGFFTAAGLDATVQTFPGGGGPMAQAVVSGALDAAVANIGAIAAAHLHGIPVYLLAPCGLYSSAAPTTVLAVAKDAPFASPRDLNGKTIGVTTLHDLQQASVMAWMDAAGADSTSVRFVEVATPQLQAALAAGRVAGGMLTEPTLTVVKNDVRVFATPYDSIAKSLVISGWMANKTWYDANPDAGARLMSVIRTTARWANQNRDGTAAILAASAQISPDALAHMARVTYAEDRALAQIQPVIDASAKYGFLAHSFPAADLFPPGRP
jgi:NitT/TauT family transport system substrate-binding protein